mmetsp:Transcript_18129/g.17280  ORF Transcript_18129/g.17280 Transcript_18129/m.17280 type:complete len:80 (-) Transcript_18129:1803-2042(-)
MGVDPNLALRLLILLFLGAPISSEVIALFVLALHSRRKAQPIVFPHLLILSLLCLERRAWLSLLALKSHVTFAYVGFVG